MSQGNWATNRFGKNNAESTRGPPATVITLFLTIAFELNRPQIVCACSMLLVQRNYLNDIWDVGSTLSQSGHLINENLSGLRSNYSQDFEWRFRMELGKLV